MKRLLALPAAAILLGVIACQETTTIGSSIVEDNISVVIDSSFTLTGTTVETGAVQSRTLTQLIGRIDDADFGSLSSTVVTQFMPASTIDTEGITDENIDSLKLIMRMAKNAFTGDSIVPMGIDVYRLNRLLPSPIYSNFSPADYYDPSQKLGSAVYSASAVGQSDTVAASPYRYIRVKMPHSLALEFFHAYKDNPSYFNEPDAFINNVFPGVYITNSYGKGRLSRVNKTIMSLYYHKVVKNETTQKDSTVLYVGNYLAVTPEVVTNNNISLHMSDKITGLLNQGDNLIVAPAGYEVEFTFPAKEIISKYNSKKGESSVVNTLTMTIPADTLANPDGIPAPPYVLMVRADKKDEFFANNQLPDNVTSFYAAYDRTNRCYRFPALRSYLMDLMKKDEITTGDVVFRLCPVQVEFEDTGSSYWDYGTTESSLVPYVQGPAMVKISLKDAKISFTYSNQTINY
ncbi:MAG: DUF4270 domain-containing protein [Muribaculaceae bacterium]|nr:DUF4270 domain-containing protein [Muribaculaceae bacterium]